MIQKNLAVNWQNKKTTKKGNIGEDIIRAMLRRQGYVIYEPVDDAPHLIDIFCHHVEKDLICIEVKTKRRRANWQDTGFDTRHYKEYIRLLENHRLDTFIAFVDDFEGCIYGQKLSHLMQFESEYKGQVYFPLSEMQFVHKLSGEQIKELRKLTTERYDYSKVRKFFDQGVRDVA